MALTCKSAYPTLKTNIPLPIQRKKHSPCECVVRVKILQSTHRGLFNAKL